MLQTVENCHIAFYTENRGGRSAAYGELQWRASNWNCCAVSTENDSGTL